MIITLDNILQHMVELNAADVNITEHQEISFRIGKDIKKIENSLVTKEHIQEMLLKLTSSSSSFVDLYKPKELDGSYRMFYKNNNYYFRYNVALTTGKIHMSIRKLINKIPDFKSIQLDTEDIKPFVEDMLKVKEGLYLVVGATGSGKSTTIVTLLDKILQEKKVKTITLESPIEYYFDINKYDDSVILQREVGKDTESFYQGLVAAMRQNPDIIFVGEIRDKDTAEAVMNASLTGHMVIATLHAKSIEKTNDRMKYLLEGVTDDFDFINGIVYQKLVRDKEKGVKAVRDVYVKKDD